MKLRTFAVVAALAASSALTAGTATAGTITLDSDTSRFSSGPGGEFAVTQFTGHATPSMGAGVQVAGAQFQTFCLEYNEYFHEGVSYDWSLGTSARSGGVSGGVGGQDPLDARTAYLYHHFWHGTLGGYDYTLGSGRVESAGQLQSAIWYLEGELSSLSTSSQAWDWVQEATGAVGDGSWSGLGNVRVLTLTDRVTGERKQDQLYVVPLPLAGLSGFLTLGFAGAAFARRRLRARG